MSDRIMTEEEYYEYYDVFIPSQIEGDDEDE